MATAPFVFIAIGEKAMCVPSLFANAHRVANRDILDTMLSPLNPPSRGATEPTVSTNHI